MLIGVVCKSQCSSYVQGPCKAIAPVFESLANYFTHVSFIKVNTDKLKVWHTFLLDLQKGNCWCGED